MSDEPETDLVSDLDCARRLLDQARQDLASTEGAFPAGSLAVREDRRRVETLEAELAEIEAEQQVRGPDHG